MLILSLANFHYIYETFLIYYSLLLFILLLLPHPLMWVNVTYETSPFNSVFPSIYYPPEFLSLYQQQLNNY